MLEMGPKPFELHISKRPGGRHFERYTAHPHPHTPSFPAPPPSFPRAPALTRPAPAVLTRPAPRPLSPRGRIPTDRYNWSIFSVFVDLAYFFQRSYNNKWLVVRTNHIAYYADVTETAPQEVLLLDRFTKVRPRRWPFFPVVAAPNPSWTHPTAHHRPQGDGLGPRPAGVQRLPRARRAHAQPASRPGPGQGHQHRAHSPKSVVFIRPSFSKPSAFSSRSSLYLSRQQASGANRTRTTRLRRSVRRRVRDGWSTAPTTLERSRTPSWARDGPSTSPTGGSRPRLGRSV